MFYVVVASAHLSEAFACLGLSLYMYVNAHFIPKTEISIMPSLFVYATLIKYANTGACFSKSPKWFPLAQIRVAYQA